MEGTQSEMDFAAERGRLVGHLETTEREVSLVCCYLVDRGNSIEVSMQHGTEVCRTQLTQENNHAKRWALCVLKRLREARTSLLQCSDELVHENVELRRRAEKLKAMWEAARDKNREISQQLAETEAERDAVESNC
eukprot:TRINITY_DN2084_c0_g1_i1.p2 TRINITY_DN2084_c0_g1~~TRINITY_DN2084_c0_g1_i1.p2  ORF type:complete len:152 (-),score=25.42 TRINITY_DN2084_c0_g1_i1:272-679(-)